jgi:hypothetical protein
MTMRHLTPELLRLLSEERKMAFIAGPRQVGKTTLVRHLLERSSSSENYFNWDVESHRKAILRNPEGFWTPARAARPRIALDEIHKYPRWKRFLKGLFDAAGARTDILVTGSGRLDVYQRGGDSLLGRYGLYRLHPFTLGEMTAPNRSARTPEELWRLDEPQQGAEQALVQMEALTGFPEPLFSGSESRLRRWRRARHHLVLREDLRDLTRIRDIGLVETLAALLPERVGSPLSLNALSEDLAVAFGSVKNWVEALGRLYYLFELRPYAGRMARALRREAKVYLFDFSEIEDPGARFENLVALHLLKLRDAWNDRGLGDYELHYVRDKEKREVDFLLTKSRRPYLLLETKLSAREISPSLLYFKERLKPAYAVQLSRERPQGPRVAASGVLRLGAADFLSLI